MFQIEVKLALIKTAFHPQDGWLVYCHVDGMELGLGQQTSTEKRRVASSCLDELKSLGVHIGAHPRFPRGDIVAVRGDPATETHLVEVEGISGRQREQAVYSALGQLLFKTCDSPDMGSISYGLAVPDDPAWRVCVERIPERVRGFLKLHLYAVRPNEVLHTEPPRIWRAAGYL